MKNHMSVIIISLVFSFGCGKDDKDSSSKEAEKQQEKKPETIVMEEQKQETQPVPVKGLTKQQLDELVQKDEAWKDLETGTYYKIKDKINQDNLSWRWDNEDSDENSCGEHWIDAHFGTAWTAGIRHYLKRIDAPKKYWSYRANKSQYLYSLVNEYYSDFSTEMTKEDSKYEVMAVLCAYETNYP